MEFNLHHYADQAYQVVSAYHPIVYDDSGVTFTWEGATVLAALLFMSFVLQQIKLVRARRKAKNVLDIKLTDAQRRFVDQIQCHLMNNVSNMMVKGSLKARHKLRLQNGNGSKPRLPDAPKDTSKPNNDFEAYIRSL